jgi:hypothetical protein
MLLHLCINKAISPVVSNVSEAVHGRLLGRVLGVSDFFVTRHMAACEQYLMASYNAASLVQVCPEFRLRLHLRLCDRFLFLAYTISIDCTSE